MHDRRQLGLWPRRELPELLATAGPLQVSDFRPEFLKAWVAESASRFPTWAPLVAFLLAIAIVILPFVYWAGHMELHTLWVSLGYN